MDHFNFNPWHSMLYNPVNRTVIPINDRPAYALDPPSISAYHKVVAKHRSVDYLLSEFRTLLGGHTSFEVSSSGSTVRIASKSRLFYGKIYYVQYRAQVEVAGGKSIDVREDYTFFVKSGDVTKSVAIRQPRNEFDILGKFWNTVDCIGSRQDTPTLADYDKIQLAMRGDIFEAL